MWFNIDWNRFGVEMLPIKWRDVHSVQVIKELLKPIMKLYDTWNFWREQNLYKLAHTGQVCYLRKSLNDRFDASLRRIYIGNGNQFKRQYIYTRAEQTRAHPPDMHGAPRAEKNPVFLGIKSLLPRNDFADGGVVFIVYVPAEIIESQIYELHAHIQFYREGVKRYKIVKI